MSMSEIELRFPRSMLGAGFELIERGSKLYFWFYDPFKGRDAMLKGSDESEATLEKARSCTVPHVSVPSRSMTASLNECLAERIVTHRS